MCFGSVLGIGVVGAQELGPIRGCPAHVVVDLGILGARNVLSA